MNKYNELKKHFQSMSIYELVNCFNRETSHNGWVSARAYYLRALKQSFIDRDVDINAVATENTFSLKYPVFYEKSESKLIPIKRKWLFPEA